MRIPEIRARVESVLSELEAAGVEIIFAVRDEDKMFTMFLANETFEVAMGTVDELAAQRLIELRNLESGARRGS